MIAKTNLISIVFSNMLLYVIDLSTKGYKIQKDVQNSKTKCKFMKK
ncbi:hypothetical protein CHK_2031 [Christensenella hongkongensis]|uniref:Uncharacterized protein n=1 Tax=Christensenella hongkongensis TaxID=270498 RepID=A0A0M2ND34_9FIRM|nr:hypothetical protein CHK_2031 [Christensenella hongkongensis]